MLKDKLFYKAFLGIVILLGIICGVWYFVKNANFSPPTYVMKEESIKAEFLTAHTSYPQIQGLSNLATQDAINQRIRSATSFSSSIENTAPTGCGASCVHDINFDSTVSELTLKYLSIQIGGYEYYPGAAHPIHFGSSLNFDLQSGKELTLSDFFKPNSNYLVVLSEKVKNDLAKQMSFPADDSQLKEGTLPNETNFSDFTLTDEGLLFFFGDYAVASYAAGNFVSLIPYSELSNILDPQFQLQISALKQTPLKASTTITATSLQTTQDINVRANDILETLQNNDIQKFSTFVHPTIGITLNSGITLGGKFTQSDIRALVSDSKNIYWGLAEASANPVNMTFKDFFDRYTKLDYSKAPYSALNRILRGGSTSPNLFIETFPSKPFLTYYYPYTQTYTDSEGKVVPNEMSWEALNLVFEKADDGQWYLVGMATDAWSI